MSQPIRSMAELLNAMRARRDQLDISHETIDAISGVPSGYTSKLFAPIPTRGIGYKSLGDVLGALGMALVPVEDPEATRLVRHRWAKRGPSGPRSPVDPWEPIVEPACIAACISPELQEHLKNIASRGGQARWKRLGKRARSKIARRAIAARWAKQATAAAAIEA
jgi:hypothetical protein